MIYNLIKKIENSYYNRIIKKLKVQIPKQYYKFKKLHPESGVSYENFYQCPCILKISDCSVHKPLIQKALTELLAENKIENTRFNNVFETVVLKQDFLEETIKNINPVKAFFKNHIWDIINTVFALVGTITGILALIFKD